MCEKHGGVVHRNARAQRSGIIGLIVQNNINNNVNYRFDNQKSILLSRSDLVLSLSILTNLRSVFVAMSPLFFTAINVGAYCNTPPQKR